MPYITKQERADRTRTPARTAGQLNYVITLMCLDYAGPAPSYSTFNEIIGVLECVKQEFYRRAIVPYEDSKIQKNGDVYP